MDYRERRREQARHKKLGTIVLFCSAFCGIVSGSLGAALIPIRIPFLPLVIAVVVGTSVFGGMKRSLGYDRRKASSQYLKGESMVEKALPTHLVTEAPVFDEPDGEVEVAVETAQLSTSEPALVSTGIVKCPHCQMKVVPKADGRCPSCQSQLP